MDPPRGPRLPLSNLVNAGCSEDEVSGSIDPNPKCLLPGLSWSAKGLRLRVNLFSSPVPEPAGDGGVALPPSVESLKALLTGLRCELLDRKDVRLGLTLREPDLAFFALGGYGMAMGDGERTVVCGRRLAEVARLGGDRDGESGELGDGDVDFDVTKRKVGVFEGDLESEWRSCRIAEVAST